jgi:hypothetical protein
LLLISIKLLFDFDKDVLKNLLFGLSVVLVISSIIQLYFVNEVTDYSSKTDNSIRTQIIRQGQYDLIVLGKLSDETVLKQKEYNENVSELLKYKNNVIVKYNNSIFNISFDRSYISDNEFAVDNMTDESKENLREYILNELQNN